MYVSILPIMGGNFVQKGIDIVLQPFINIILVACIIAVALAVLVTILIEHKKQVKLQKEADAAIGDLDTKLQLSQAAMESLKTGTDSQLKLKDELISQMARNYEKNLEDTAPATRRHSSRRQRASRQSSPPRRKSS